MVNPFAIFRAAPVIAALLPAIAALLPALPAANAAPATGETLVLAYVGDKDASAHLGARQGTAEANLQGRFLGHSYRLERYRDAAEAASATPLAVLAAVSREQLLALADAFPGVPVFNLSLDEDALRAQCRDNLLHVPPSRGMKRDAARQWQRVHPDAKETAGAAWHPRFLKFAARDLNKRYAKEFQREMDDDAWAGWAAAKIVSEAVVQEGLDKPAALLRALWDGFSFDGQKGAALSFRATGQLRQPVLVQDGDGQLLGEAPVRGAARPEDLDSLGRADCPK